MESVQENLSAPCLSLIVMVVVRTQQRPRTGVILNDNVSASDLQAHSEAFRHIQCVPALDRLEKEINCKGKPVGQMDCVLQEAQNREILKEWLGGSQSV